MMPTPNLYPIGDSIYESIKRQGQKTPHYIAEVLKYHPATYYHLGAFGAKMAAKGVSKAASGTASVLSRNKKKIVLVGVAKYMYDRRGTLETNPRGRLMRPIGGTTQRSSDWAKGTLTYQIGSKIADSLGLMKNRSRVI